MPDGGPLRGSAISSDEFARLMAGCFDFAVQPEALAVAVSGGADSMALCLLAHTWAAARGVRLTALTVDHGLRLESADEAAQVGLWLNARGIAHHILTWNHDTEISSRVQERARDARYALMRQWCLDHGVDRLLLAHHLEDQAETVLMRLKKGSGLLGLAGMAQERDLDGVMLMRPLLGIAKARLRANLEAVGQDWIEDPSNQNRRFERVRTRNLLTHLQDEGVSAQGLANAAAAIARVRDVVDRAAIDLIATAVQMEKGLLIDAHRFGTAPAPVRHHALTKLLAQIGGGAYPPARTKLARLLAWMAAADSQGDGARTLGGCTVRCKERAGRRSFLICAESPRTSHKHRKNTGINCETALAPRPQTPYIQGNSHRRTGRVGAKGL
ncbi:tRNA lysidine(34) synthetase TilS [Magnetovibrio sp.]|uniref:tRNA lysidine(34) synthetase TilS n=1 Tax=Magnetovibrio sp. TaxID=2024836 RepID=UPI002F95E694